MVRYVLRCGKCQARATVDLGATGWARVDEMEALLHALTAAGFKRAAVYRGQDQRGRLSSRFGCCTADSLKMRPVNGTMSPETKCDDLCTHATGAECRCSCGGANHGAAISLRSL